MDRCYALEGDAGSTEDHGLAGKSIGVVLTYNLPGFWANYLQYESKAESQLGVKLVPKEWPDFPANSLGFILTAEAAAAFDELTVTKRDKLLTSNSWASRFRLHRFVPAVEYIQANRARTLLIREMDRLFEDMDIYMDSHLGITNLTGHPELVLPDGFREDGTPYSVSFTGKLFGEPKLLCLAHQYQQATGHHLKHPEL